MGYTIAVAGKGGTGKTTISALIVRLIAEKKLGSVLAVDADPNSNLGECLGLSPAKSVGELIDDISANPDVIPPGTPKERFLNYTIQTHIVEGTGFDLLAMGRPEGPGCYCYVNNVLRGIVEGLIHDYDYTVIDNEAGLEHLSRRTTRSADLLAVISDPTVVGLRSAQRIHDLVKELGIKVKRECLIINKADKDFDALLMHDIGVEYIGGVPFAPEIAKMSVMGTPVFALAHDSAPVRALGTILDKLLV